VTHEDARQQTFQLVALGDIDDKRSEAQKLIDSVPRVLASRQRESRGAQTQVDAAKEKLKGFQAHLKSLELDLASREEALAKANTNLMGAKSNQEYSLLMAEIARKKEDKGEIEDRILEQYDVIRQGERIVVEWQDRLKQAMAEFGEFETRALGELKDHQRELHEFDLRREAVRKALDSEALQLYDRAYRAHGSAIVPAEGKICQGCFSSLTPNDNNRLLSGRQLVLCRSCQRILYMPEALQASPS